jgi:RHH-type proline utilization regulon transcriptional repressor/proline dehydrogenase/delta 1-pyrroline-5-carboxylate dehydrogenase
MSSQSSFQESLKQISSLYRADEETSLKRLFPLARLAPDAEYRVRAKAENWINKIRHAHRPDAGATDLLSRFGLTSQEGIALMCLAEALLRIPDVTTADALIRDKLNETHWNEALGKDAPWMINAAGWALTLTGKVIGLDAPNAETPGAVLGNLISRLGQPVIREALRHAMQWLADQFVVGETIDKALARAQIDMQKDIIFSFDMLGEGARSAEDAERYFQDYVNAIDAVGKAQAEHGHIRASGISVKLSALHPRYEMVQRKRVLKEMVPKIVALCEQSAKYDIPMTLDAEEADRLQLSLEIAEIILKQQGFKQWHGLGFAVQAYQKRAPAVIDCLAELAKANNKRIHIRLVKGAYWDTEIKRAQERGWADFPVYTRKASTDVSYLACARKILEQDKYIQPVFGSHNALTVAHVLELAGDKNRVEFQRLHGMGEDLGHLMQAEGLKCCVYAPVGNHDVLLGYLVRRILENGANSSFVHRLLDSRVPIDELTTHPVDEVLSHKAIRHPSVRRSPDLYKPDRLNSSGLDLTDPFVTDLLQQQIVVTNNKVFSSAALVNGQELPNVTVDKALSTAFEASAHGFSSWNNLPVDARAKCLENVADHLEQNNVDLLALLVSEGRKTLPDALAEVREAVDFCRYYALRAREDFKPIELPGPTGERNTLRLSGRGTFVCISPWNFPLAIFLGQVAAALVAGNAVIAKPAPQTPRIATYVGHILHQSGIPANVVHILNGGTDMGGAIIKHPLVAGVCFTGSTATARTILRSLAAKDGPIVPLIAETGGQNAMIVDSSALAEQVVDDVVMSCFRSAGQRCSALRLLCLPEPTADKIMALIKGAMRELRVGDSGKLETDVGAVIDELAQKRLLDHVERLKKEAREIYTTPLANDAVNAPFVSPQAWEIPSIEWLTGEVFGPILHIIRYEPQQLGQLIQRINATGFGLTGGLHSRIENTVQQVERDLNVGNFYVNRSIIGAVVGVQPFGGQGLSGTGPKAGGPHYLSRFATERVSSVNTTAAGGNASLLMSAST